MCLAAKHLTLVVFCTFLPAAILCPSRPARPPPARGRRHLPRRGRGAPRDGGAGPPPAPYPRPRAAAIAPSLRSRRCHGDPRRRGGRPGAVSLSAGVAIRQRRDGLQLQREEEVRDLAPPLALPRPGWKGNGGTGPLRGGAGGRGRGVWRETCRGGASSPPRPAPLRGGSGGGEPGAEGSCLPPRCLAREAAVRARRAFPELPGLGRGDGAAAWLCPGASGRKPTPATFGGGGGGGMQARFYTTLCAQSSGYLASLSKSPLLVSRPPPLRNQFCKSFAKQRGGGIARWANTRVLLKRLAVYFSGGVTDETRSRSIRSQSACASRTTPRICSQLFLDRQPLFLREVHFWPKRAEQLAQKCLRRFWQAECHKKKPDSTKDWCQFSC